MILLDTHALVWSVLDPRRLSKDAASAIRRARRQDGIAIAAITLLELAGLLVRGRVRLPGTLEAALHKMTDRLVVKPLTVEIASVAAQFSPPFPGDPADRLIAATALVEDIPLVTHDQRLLDSPRLRTIW